MTAKPPFSVVQAVPVASRKRSFELRLAGFQRVGRGHCRGLRSAAVDHCPTSPFEQCRSSYGWWPATVAAASRSSGAFGRRKNLASSGRQGAAQEPQSLGQI